jgi:hypothetical protein
VIGDQADIVGRLRLTLPGRWFADSAPVLDGVLAGLSSVWAALFDLLQFVKQQSRLLTATGQFLDLASLDFFGNWVQRRSGEADDAYRARIQRAMAAERGTRAGLIAAAAEAGFSLQVFEPAQPRDTGVYGNGATLSWNTAGGWGSWAMPLECLVTAQGSAGADESALRAGLSRTVPAGGVAWLRIEG